MGKSENSKEDYDFGRMMLEYKSDILVSGSIGVVRSLAKFSAHDRLKSAESFEDFGNLIRQMRSDIGLNLDPYFQQHLLQIFENHIQKDVVE